MEGWVQVRLREATWSRLKEFMGQMIAKDGKPAKRYRGPRGCVTTWSMDDVIGELLRREERHKQRRKLATAKKRRKQQELDQVDRNVAAAGELLEVVDGADDYYEVGPIADAYIGSKEETLAEVCPELRGIEQALPSQ